MTSAVAPQAAIPSKLTLPEHRDAYYGGQWHKPKNGRYADTLSPGTGESLGKVADCGAADAEAAIAAAATAFKEWRRVLPLERAKILKRIAQVLRDNAGELAMIDAADCGNPGARDGERRHDRGGAARFLRRLGHGDEGRHHSDGARCGEFLGARADGRGRAHHPVQSSLHVLRGKIRGSPRRRQYGGGEAAGTVAALVVASRRTLRRPAAARRVQCRSRRQGGRPGPRLASATSPKSR